MKVYEKLSINIVDVKVLMDHFHDAVAGTKLRFRGALAAIIKFAFFPNMRSKGLLKC